MLEKLRYQVREVFPKDPNGGQGDKKLSGKESLHTSLEQPEKALDIS